MYKLFNQICIKDYFEYQDRNSLYRDFFLRSNIFYRKVKSLLLKTYLTRAMK